MNRDAITGLRMTLAAMLCLAFTLGLAIGGLHLRLPTWAGFLLVFCVSFLFGQLGSYLVTRWLNVLVRTVHIATVIQVQEDPIIPEPQDKRIH